MGSEIIQARYDQLEQIAVRFGQQAEAAAQTTQRVQQSMRALQAGGWEGRGAAAYFGEMERSVLPSMQRLAAALQQSQTVTRQISQVLQAAEEEASRPFRGQGAAPQSAPAEQGGGFWGAVGDFFSGAGAELKDMATGLWGLVTDPVGAATGLWYGITHPGELWNAIKQPYVEAWESGHPWEAIGRGTVAVVTTVLGTKGADKVAKLLKGTAVVDDVARAGSAMDDAARMAELAGKSADEIAAINRARFAPTFEAAEAAARVPRILDISEQYSKVAVGAEGSQALADDLARLTAHGSGDRVVLGPWKAWEAADYVDSYIAQAKSGGGIWFETPDGMYKVLGSDRMWQVNESFLRQQLESGAPIHYVGESIADVLDPKNAGRASYKEIQYLMDHAADYGYTFDPITGVWTK
jgi:WXG100 family type VII secretion target